jgi:hypothetical protein
MPNNNPPIPLNDARAYTRNWREYNAVNTVNNLFKLNEMFPSAFTFDLSDVTPLVNDPRVAQVRVYFGYDQAEPAPSPTSPMKVMLVGVDAEGRDLVNEGEGESGIYDFATPCPPTCDPASPLMNN